MQGPFQDRWSLSFNLAPEKLLDFLRRCSNASVSSHLLRRRCRNISETGARQRTYRRLMMNYAMTNRIGPLRSCPFCMGVDKADTLTISNKQLTIPKPNCSLNRAGCAGD